jgi:hypothetical protein
MTAPASTSTRPPTIDDKVLAVVDEQWRTAREIFAAVDEGAPVSVRHALTRLANAGRVERSYSPDRNGEITRYRRNTEAANPP